MEERRRVQNRLSIGIAVAAAIMVTVAGGCARDLQVATQSC
jgi:hypothetical protein